MEVFESGREQPDAAARILADVLDACRAEACVPEKYWLALVRAIAAGDPVALHALYLRSCRMVHTWVLRIAGNRAAADEVTVDVFHQVWRRASTYDAADGSVLAWVLNQAREHALDRLVGDRRRECAARTTSAGLEPDTIGESFLALWKRLARRLATETGRESVVSRDQPPDQEWEDVAPGIACKFLAKDEAGASVAMLVRMMPGAVYPPHTHAGVEQLYMFEGELRVDERIFRAGDYLRSEPGTSDHRVWTETGCAGVLITSTRDILL